MAKLTTEEFIKGDGGNFDSRQGVVSVDLSLVI